MTIDEQGFQEWLATRPTAIRDLAEQWPPMTIVLIEGQEHYVIGYLEAEGAKRAGLLVSKVKPTEDYDDAVNSSVYICPDCLSPATPP